MEQINNNMLLKLTIEPLKNELNNIKLIETVPTEILDLLINSSLLKQQFNNPFSSICFDNEKQQLEKYKKLVKNGEATILYTQTKNMKFGRVFPKNALGLFSIRREIRHTIARDNYIDIDVENCHPVILYQICKQNNIKCKYLKRYIDDRLTILNDVMTKYNVVKDQAKQLFIQLLYFGTFNSWCTNNKVSNTEPLKFVSKFKDELNLIGEIIIANNQKLANEIKKKKEEQNIKDYNLKGSVCSYFLQEYENRILETIFLYCKENKLINNNCVLCADGLMIPKDNYKEELLLEFKNVINNKLGFDLNFTKKDMNQGYTIEQLKETQIKTKEEENDDESTENYNKIKVEFEKNNFKVLNPIMFVTIGDEGQTILRDKTDFKTVYENLCYLKLKNKKFVSSSFIDDWLKDKTNRTYYKLDFLPAQEAPNNIYNTFKGFEAEKKELFDVNIEDSLIMKHIKEVISNNDPKVFKYIINFLSVLLQHPHKKANTALIIKSVEGVGKDTIFNWFGNKILGKNYYFNDDSAELLFGRFNSSMENKILCILNEASGKDTHVIDGKIKNAITRDYNKLEKKGLEPYDNTNNIGYVFLTNNDNPIKVPADDRRFCGIECNNKYANNKEYFTNLYAEINSGKYDKAFYNYFLNVNLNGFDFINERPTTSFYNNMKELNTPIIVKFLEKVIDENNKNCSFSSTQLFDNFNEFIKTNNFKVEYTSTKFGIDIKNFDGIEKKKTRTFNVIEINIQKLKEHLIQKYKLEFCDFIDPENEIEEDEKICPLDVINR